MGDDAGLSPAGRQLRGTAAGPAPRIRNLGGKIGLVVLAVCALSLAGAALFPIDPITTSSRQAGTTNGMLHALTSMTGIPGTAIAAALIARGLFKNKAWNRARPAVLVTTILIWLSLAGMFLAMALTLPADGKFSPAVLIGWPNRILMLTWCARVLALARRAARWVDQCPYLLKPCIIAQHRKSR